MQLTFVTGTTGTEKRAVLECVKGYAEEHGLASPGDIEIFHVEDELKALGKDLQTFADTSVPSKQREWWSAAVERIHARIEDRRPQPKFVFISFHYYWYYRKRIFTPVDWSPLRRLANQASHFIFVTLIDDCYAMWARITNRPTNPREIRLAECITWRSFEVSAADLCARELAPELDERRERPLTAEPRSYVVSVNHPPATLARLAFRTEAKRLYLCYPISIVRRAASQNEAQFPASAIDAFRHRVQDDYPYVVFDPLGIDEEILALKLADLDAADTAQDRLVIEPSDRWPIPEQRRLLGESAIAQAGRTLVRYPLELPVDQVREAAELAHYDIPSRDLRWVDDAHCLVAYRPFWGNRPHTGTQTEINRATFSGARVIAYSPPEDRAASPFATGVPIIPDEQEFYNAVGAFGAG